MVLVDFLFFFPWISYWLSTIYWKYNHFPMALQWHLSHESGVCVCVYVHLFYSSPQLFVRVELLHLLQLSKSLPSGLLPCRAAQQGPGLRLDGSWDIAVFGVNSVGFEVQQSCIVVFVV